MALTPYTGQWTKDEAAHLLRRTLFGPTLQQINESVSLGLDATISQLFNVPTFTKPLTFLPEETICPLFETWVDSMYPAVEPFIGYHEIARKDSLLAWLIERINNSNFSIQEMMCLFWQNHFACKPTLDSRASFQYFEKIQNYATCNYKNFLKEITIDPCMLMFLNGAQNTSISPNENFAREILELYTVGKGPLIRVGDYTHYTEQDVMEGAKIFTGWTVGGFLSDSSMPFSSFNSLLPFF